MNASNVVNANNAVDAMNVRGRLLTTQRWKKVASSIRSTKDERKFGDSGYEVTM